MELSDSCTGFTQGVHASNKALPIEQILDSHKFEKIVIVSTYVKSIINKTTEHLDNLGVPYEQCPSALDYHLEVLNDDFVKKEKYNPKKDLFLIVYRQQDANHFKAIDNKIELGVGVFVPSKKIAEANPIFQAAHTLLIPRHPVEEFSEEYLTATAAYCTGYFLAKSNKDENLMSKLSSFRNEKKHLVYYPVNPKK